MSRKFQESHYCKVFPIRIMADCPACATRRCHKCDSPGQEWWADYCPECYRALSDKELDNIKRHHVHI